MKRSPILIANERKMRQALGLTTPRKTVRQPCRCALCRGVEPCGNGKNCPDCRAAIRAGVRRTGG